MCPRIESILKGICCRVREDQFERLSVHIIEINFKSNFASIDRLADFYLQIGKFHRQSYANVMIELILLAFKDF